MKHSLLVLVADRPLRQRVRDELRAGAFRVLDMMVNGAVNGTPDVACSVVQFGGTIDGSTDVLDTLRAERPFMPILGIAIGAGPLEAALAAGVDDVVLDGSVDAELVPRVRTLIERGNADGDRLRLRNVTIDRLQHRVEVDGEEIHLTPLEFHLLEYLAVLGGRVISRQALLRAVWHKEAEPASNLLDVHLARLRRKVRAAGADVEPRTVRGRGVRLARPVRRRP